MDFQKIQWIWENRSKNITMDLSECGHLAKIQKTAGKDILWILQCEKDTIDMKIHIGVRVPESWKGRELYLYEYREEKLVLQESKIRADKEGYAEILLKHGVDQIITDRPASDKNLSSWVEGLTGENRVVNQMYAIISLGAFLTAVAGMIYLFKKRQSS